MFEKNEHFEFEHERVDHTLKAGTHDSYVRAVRTGSVRSAHTGRVYRSLVAEIQRLVLVE